MDIAFIKKGVRSGKYDLSVHAHNERQEEQITVEEIEKVILKGDIYRAVSKRSKRRKLSNSWYGL